METISMKDFDAKAQELGSVGAALNWARENGYELPPANRELPPVAEKGALAAAAEADAEQADADAEQADVDAAGALDLANLDFGQIKSDPNAFFSSILAANQAAEERAALSSKQLYEEGRKRIMEKYAGPSQSERLFALSKAMLSPTKTPGFAGFLGNVTGALSENAKAAREAEQTREEQLLALQQQYQQGEAARLAARPKTAADLASKYLAATKTKDPFAGAVWDAENQRWVLKPGSAGGPPVLTPQQVAELSRDPRNRGMKFYTTDGRPMEIK